MALDDTDMKVHHSFPLTPHLHSPSPLPKKRCHERSGRAEVGGVSMLLLDNASSVWLEGEGFLLGHVMGLGTLWK